MNKIFIDACFGKKTEYTPIWLMRQAGRYLPEYMKVRGQAGTFLDLSHNPKLAAEVTLQPVDILNVDAAILFSDILVIPDEMGMDLSFVKGEGPKFSDPIQTQADLDKLIGGDNNDTVSYEYLDTNGVVVDLANNTASVNASDYDASELIAGWNMLSFNDSNLIATGATGMIVELNSSAADEADFNVSDSTGTENFHFLSTYTSSVSDGNKTKIVQQFNKQFAQAQAYGTLSKDFEVSEEELHLQGD